ncbi:hypothetical protein M527_06665 [Sphingobium indicum IP26]|uniref:Uncharacterized protein n=1 Tax=Sphingobium indicum F2 TaxID=1450518 RepID=A0A8E0WTP6_9SPHN|nr:hypothetical protein [Sphingobium indicum]EPR09805.1 hypothetical protein M527_06665 [Sphingobium indicum IP26]KER37247.1 hypothetical protein AL00_06120 [Sphingobium indicum F2]
MSVVEKVAAALWFDYVDQQGYPNGLPTWQEMVEGEPLADALEHYRSLAVAAIAAMREPTPAMVDAGAQLCDAAYSGKAVHAAWQAMIDAALDGEG